MSVKNMLLNGNVRRIRMFQKRKEEIEMKKTWKVFLTVLTALVAVVLVACGQGTASKDNKEAELKKIELYPRLDTKYQPHRALCCQGKRLFQRSWSGC